MMMGKEKTYTMKEVIEKIKNRPKEPIVNDVLEKKLKKMVFDLVKKECRAEALNILLKSSEKKIGEFLYYFYSDKFNVACMVIDSAKNDLVKSGKMKQKKGDHFGIDWLDGKKRTNDGKGKK